MKKTSKRFPIIIAAIAVFFSAILSLLIFSDRIVATLKLCELESAVNASDMMILSDPRYTDGMDFSSREVVLSAKELESVKEELLPILDSLSFSSVRSAEAGSWDMNLAFVSDGGTSRLYLLSDEVYIESGSRRIIYAVDEKDMEKYEMFLDFLKEKIINLR